MCQMTHKTYAGSNTVHNVFITLLQVLNSSRSDWWLVSPMYSSDTGWVPADYLEKQVLDGPTSPPPEPFVDTGELARIMER